MTEIVHWNSKRPSSLGVLSEYLPTPWRINNFGDLLGPIIVDRLLADRGLANVGGGRLLTVGSIIHMSKPGDTIWGSGVNGRIKSLGGVPDLDVRAVRGPLTRELLIGAGVKLVPENFGDPGLLVSIFWPRSTFLLPKSELVELTIVPNYHDWRKFRHDERSINPRLGVFDVIGKIARSKLVISTSLHGVVVAESFGIPARLLTESVEPEFKYRDYYDGTGRSKYRTATSIAEAISMGGESAPKWDPVQLLESFPFDVVAEVRGKN